MAPFVDNSRGTLIQFPWVSCAVQFSFFDSQDYTTCTVKVPHIGIQFWCGMRRLIGRKNITLLSSPPVGRIFVRAVRTRRPLTDCRAHDELAMRHVHKGRTVARSNVLQSGAARHARGRRVTIKIEKYQPSNGTEGRLLQLLVLSVLSGTRRCAKGGFGRMRRQRDLRNHCRRSAP